MGVMEKMGKGNRYFPVFIDLTDKECIVYGGGTIAYRRVSGLLRFGAKVTVYAPDIKEELRKLWKTYPQTLTLCEQPYQYGIPKADFVFSCVDDRGVDMAIYEECRKKGVPVNIASDQSMCDFYFPALVETEDIVIGISSGGRDHKKVREIAGKLREWIGGKAWK